MKLELRNVKYAAFASQETSCFRATVYIDDKREGEVSNEGHGGPNEYQPWALQEKLNAHGATLPRIQYEGWSAPQDADMLIDDLLVAHLRARDLRAKMAKNLVFTRADKPGIWQVRMKQPNAIEAIVKDDGLLAAWKHRHNAKQVLNVLPFEEALAVFGASVRT